MRKITFATWLFLLLAIPAISQDYLDYAAGLRIGDPLGITLKRYLDMNNTLEFTIGMTPAAVGINGPEDKFPEWFSTNYDGYYESTYVGYNGTFPLVIQLHYLRQRHIKKEYANDQSGLAWYFGGGGHLRYHGYAYDFTYKRTANSHEQNVLSRVDEVGLGIDAKIGLEYNFYDLPYSIFLDGALFFNLIDKPVKIMPLPGIGIRHRWD